MVEPEIRKVVLVVIDGLRPDAIAPERMPTLHSLQARGWSPSWARTVRPSVTVAALTSLATGVSPERHGLVEPTFSSLGRIRELSPLPVALRRLGVTTTVVAPALGGAARWVAGALLRLGGVRSLATRDAAPGLVCRRAAELVSQFRERHFVVAYVNDTDLAGHAWGWMSAPYLRAAAAVDRALDPFIALADAPDTLVIITADHGGGGVLPHDHDHPHPLNERIPLCLLGGRVQSGTTAATECRLLDIPPTVLWIFGGIVPAQYEGRVLAEAFTPQLVLT